MPTDIELSYLGQGYALPEGMTWTDVDARRKHWDIDPIFVPIARVPGACIGWGVPFIDGKPLKHLPGRGAERSSRVSPRPGSAPEGP